MRDVDQFRMVARIIEENANTCASDGLKPCNRAFLKTAQGMGLVREFDPVLAALLNEEDTHARSLAKRIIDHIKSRREAK